MLRLRRPPLRVWVWTAATLVLVVVAALLWRGSDAAATESTTAAPAGVPAGTPAGAVSAAWTADSTSTPDAAPRDTVHDGRVVLVEERGVRTVDALTGAEAWRYIRTNARLCDATVVGGLVVAVFRTADRCDEAVALSAATGMRSWTRNVNFRTDMTLASTDGIVLATGPTGVVTLDPVGDNIRWRQPTGEGCSLLDSGVGRAGVVVLQRCAGAAALQLRLFDGFEGRPVWTRDVADRSATLAGVDGVVTVAGADGVQFLAAADGAPLGSLPPAATVRTTALGDTTLVLADGTLSAVDQATGTVRWAVPARGLPAAGAKTLPDRSPVPVPEGGGFVLRDLATGAELDRWSAPDLPSGGLARVVGPAVVLQPPGRVLAYR
ncbi:PQQ-binding-like beta-propeller repeat protein [Geodermatophilus ruber]|uniref:Outer membrane protein assembly factor BamB, contains PQQ-like beta-propeller repeat n=1 Tax=Geodermatophilus ruber TaxID=504800 RepID=A0A1I4JKS7_9ACTN|nr:PQQ-binding-like beta-propeller repeat protein [Geodermatophilus ruber]SFL67084.1 Outer membrane protein assembly factor BamB, contains PQQ-like beta-propeller repeat [Geodermatophilus ruber]